MAIALKPQREDSTERPKPDGIPIDGIYSEQNGSGACVVYVCARDPEKQQHIILQICSPDQSTRPLHARRQGQSSYTMLRSKIEIARINDRRQGGNRQIMARPLHEIPLAGAIVALRQKANDEELSYKEQLALSQLTEEETRALALIEPYLKIFEYKFGIHLPE